MATEATVIDPTTRSGFLEIAASHGRPAAHSARIAALEGRLAAAQGFRWHDRNPQRELDRARFEAMYETSCPENCQLLREAGIGY